MNRLPKIVQARLQTQTTDAHPDADVLTAFYEQALPENERVPVLAHLALCPECRDVVGMALPALEEPRVIVARPASAWGWPQMVRWGSLAVCIAVVGAAVLIHKPTPAVVRPSTEAEVSAERDTVSTGIQNDKVGTNAAPVARQDLRADAEQKKAPVALSEKKPPAARVASKKAADLQTAKERPDLASVQSTTGGAVGGTVRSSNAAPSPAPALAVGGMKSETAAMGNYRAANSIAAPPAPAADQKLADTPGRAKVGSTGANEVVTVEASAALSVPVLAKAGEAAAANVASLPAQFVLSPEGQLQRSFDSGKSWEPVPVVERAKFTAIAVMGPEVWVGGAAGVLYHSADNGRQWKLMKPSVQGVALTADITSVRFTDMQHLAVITSDGQAWTTADGGQTWERKR